MNERDSNYRPHFNAASFSQTNQKLRKRCSFITVSSRNSGNELTRKNTKSKTALFLNILENTFLS